MTPRQTFEFLSLGALWGASFLFMRVASSELGPTPLVGIRLTVAALLLLGVLAARRGLGELHGRLLRLTLLGAINSAIPFMLFAYATLSLPAGFTSVLNATAPLLGAMVGALVFGEAMGGRRISTLLAGFLGVAVLVSPRLSRGGDALAVLAGLLASLGYAVGAHYTRRALTGVPPLAIAAGSMAGGSLLLFPFAILSWPRTTPSATAVNAAVALGVGCTAAAYILYFRLIEEIGAVKAVAVAYLIPVFGTLWGALVLGEPVTPAMLAGGALIVGSTALLNSTREAAPQAAAKPSRKENP